MRRRIKLSEAERMAVRTILRKWLAKAERVADPEDYYALELVRRALDELAEQ